MNDLVKILFIDDRLEDRILMQEFLSPLANISITVSEEKPALEICENFHGVIVDQNLGNGLLGVDVAAAIHSIDPMIPIMLYTGEDQPEELDLKSVIDNVCSKGQFPRLNIELESFIKQVKRIKELRDRIKDLEKELGINLDQKTVLSMWG